MELIQSRRVVRLSQMYFAQNGKARATVLSCIIMYVLFSVLYKLVLSRSLCVHYVPFC
jgi:hypothetical protein